uniref:non-specific serine/threonine protein kinase n=1 Tax=Palpitomonas bilix TaxID=652834 RepID=A0A7S3G2V1_9EUKA
MDRQASSKVIKETKELSKTEDDDGNKFVNAYQVLNVLGRGAYGKVKLARHTETRDLYAIKILKKSMLKRKRIGRFSNALQNIMKEIAIMKKIEHPNCLQLFEVIDSPNEDKMYLVLEYCDGGAVMSGAKEQDPLSEAQARDILRQSILGLSYLHAQQIAHRDIKPENILRDKSGVVKIADFGVALIWDGESDMTSSSAGTPAFMSPEVCAGAKQFSAKKADIWALGVTLFFFVFGGVPYKARTELDMYRMIREEPVVIPDTINPQLHDLLSKMLEKDPNKRISLNDMKVHPWITNNGAEPLHEGRIEALHVSEQEVEHAVHRLIDNFALLVNVKRRMSKIKLHVQGELAKKSSASSIDGSQQ